MHSPSLFVYRASSDTIPVQVVMREPPAGQLDDEEESSKSSSLPANNAVTSHDQKVKWLLPFSGTLKG